MPIRSGLRPTVTTDKTTGSCDFPDDDEWLFIEVGARHGRHALSITRIAHDFFDLDQGMEGFIIVFSKAREGRIGMLFCSEFVSKFTV